jgi:hypothetical protein
MSASKEVGFCTFCGEDEVTIVFDSPRITLCEVCYEMGASSEKTESVATLADLCRAVWFILNGVLKKEGVKHE